MSESNSQPEEPQAQPRFSQEQYDMLKRCSDKKDITEWNEWRKEHPAEDVWLQGRRVCGWWLREANFMHGAWGNAATGEEIHYTGEVHFEESLFEWADLRGAHFSGANMNDTNFWSAHAEGACFGNTSLIRAQLGVANFENCDFRHAILENASFTPSQLNGAKFINSNLRGCSMRMCEVDGSTRFWNCVINRYSKGKRCTDLTGTALDNVLITVGQKQLLEYNIRRKNWGEWYKQHKILKWPVWLFWLMSDYGLSTGRIITVFLGFALVFAAIYYLWGLIAPPGIVDYLFVDPSGVKVGCGLALLRAIHFSVVIMTVGFTNMHANAHSFWAHILVGFQMILGFVLLGALVTRFAVLFTAGGPAGKFADEKTIWERLKELWNKIKKKR